MVGTAERQLRDVEVDDLPLGQAAVLQRALLVPRLGEVAGAKLALVDDQQAAFTDVLRVGLPAPTSSMNLSTSLSRQAERWRKFQSLFSATKHNTALLGSTHDPRAATSRFRAPGSAATRCRFSSV